MDTLDISALAGLTGYALGYIHSNLTRKSIKQTAEKWLYSAVAQVATFGLVVMDENKIDERKLSCTAHVDGREVSILITEVTK